MLIHYLKITFRNIWKYKTQAFIGILGLAFALACFVPALYWLRYETTYDSFYTDSERIYRIYAIEKQSGKVNEQVPGILAKKMSEQVPAVEATTIFMAESNNCKTEMVPHIQLRTLNTDSTFFQVFKLEFVSGDAYQPLQVLFNIVLTESVAIRLFGDIEKAIGQQIQSTFYFFNPPYTVTAVVKDPPPHTNLPFDALLNHDLLANFASAPENLQWIQFNAQMYVKFHSHTDFNKMADELRDFTSNSRANTDIEVRMVPISDARHRLNTDMPFTLNFIRLFVAAGILLLFSAIFNFLNLYLDLFRQRNNELHQRAVHGAKSRQLIWQMLFELACSILLALLLGCCFIVLTRPVFSGLLDLTMGISQLIHFFMICGFSVMALILLIGFSTFWRLSHLALRPLSKRKTNRQPVLRRMAVTLQLAVSVVFIVAALVVMMQMRFVNNKDLGFDRNGIIQLYGLPPYMEKSLRTSLMQEIMNIPQIESITTSNFVPQHKANTHEMISKVEWPGKPPHEMPAFNLIPTDYKFAETFHLEMLMGEWWKEGAMQKIVLNEEAVRVMGLSNPVGTMIRLSIDDVDVEIESERTMQEYEIVGVVKDFHTLSFRSRIHPTIFRTTLSGRGRIVTDNILYMHVIPGQEQEVIKQITAMLPGIDPSFASIKLTLLDNLYDNFNHSEQTGLKMFSVLATVCLLISLFGIYAVASASTERRRKEIAIRKVVGAKAHNIAHIFSRDYILQVIIASVFALPLSYIAMSHWLQGYAYRTNIPWWLLLGVIMGVIIVVLLTVLGQVYKAAKSNPAEVVKSE